MYRNAKTSLAVGALMIFTAAWNQSLILFLLGVIVLDVTFSPESGTVHNSETEQASAVLHFLTSR